MSDHNTLLELTVRIVTGAHDPLGLSLKDRIASVYTALATTGQPAIPDAPSVPEPAVPVRQSIKPDYIVCLEDGKKFKLLIKVAACKRPSRDATRLHLIGAHRDKMARPQVVLTDMIGVPASINRHTGKPHEHRAKRARRGAPQYV